MTVPEIHIPDFESPVPTTTTTQFSTVADGSTDANKNTFVYGPDVWTSASASGSDDWFTTYNPCPSGWRVPTYDELNTLIGETGTSGIDSGGWDSAKNGYWFNGSSTPSVEDGLFLPAAGYRTCNDGSANSRGGYGYYWCSSADNDSFAWILRFDDFNESACVSNAPRANGHSIRCVHD